ncbi:AMP-binding protein [Bacteriovoracaceae bacterium]|nr:AMP-binding protein [Bacteriovoracaceae bacterium]
MKDYIQNVISNFISNDIKIFDKKYEKVSSNKIKEDLNKIQKWMSSNLEVGEKIAIYLDNYYYYPLSIIASMNLGIVFIPMKNDWPQERIEQVQKISQYKILLDKELLSQILDADDDTTIELPELVEESPLYIMFTSGSTGEPKGVEILRKSYGNFLEWISRSFEEINESDRLINSTHYTFDVALMELGLLLVKNVNFYSSNMGQNPLVLARELSELKITISVTVPNNYNLLLSEKIFSDIDLSNLKSVFLAGSRFPTNIWDQFKKLLPEVHLYNCFGPTEATIYCLFKKMTSERSKDIQDDTVSIGKALLNLEAQIVDENGEALPVGQRGELIIGGVQVMSRYINSDELTNQVILNKKNQRFYKTCDLAFQNKEGEFFVVGRNDDTVKVSGQRVNLSDVDSYILKLPEVKDCATIAIKHEITNYQLICFAVMEKELSVMELKNKLKEVLLPFQIPAKIIFKNELPLNNSGKIDKKLLKNEF